MDMAVAENRQGDLNQIGGKKSRDLVVVLVALYRDQNFPIRIFHPLLEDIDGVTPHTIFFKHVDSNYFDPPSEKESELFAETIADLKPDLVGFSLLSPHSLIAEGLNKVVRDNSSAKIIWGGVHPTIDPEACIKQADIICIGEGEGAITDLVQRMRDGEDYDDIQNLWIKNDNGVVKNPGRDLIQDLDSLPFPAYGNDSFIFINDDKIGKFDHAIEDRLLWIQGSRGCPFVCTYCVNSVTQPLFRGEGNYRRVRSVRNVVDEIKGQLALVKEVNLPEDWKSNVLFVDEVFGNDKEWMKEFESVYPKEVGLPYFMETLPHPNLLNETTLDMFVNSGVDTISFGIQAGTDYIRNKIFRRPTKNKEIIGIANDIASRGVTIRCDFILDNPWDTEESLKEAIELFFQLPKPLFFHLYRTQWFPEYPLTKKAIADGLISKEDATLERLIATPVDDWIYVPKLALDLPGRSRLGMEVYKVSKGSNKKIMIQNIIWLLVWGHVSDKFARYAVFNNSAAGRFCLHYLNIKAVIFGKVVGVGGLKDNYPWVKRFLATYVHVRRGEIKEVLRKAANLIRYSVWKSRQSESGSYSGYHKLSDWMSE